MDFFGGQGWSEEEWVMFMCGTRDPGAVMLRAGAYCPRAPSRDHLVPPAGVTAAWGVRLVQEEAAQGMF